MKYSPIVPYFMITAMTCNMQFYTRKTRKDKRRHQNPIYYKIPFHYKLNYYKIF